MEQLHWGTERQGGEGGRAKKRQRGSRIQKILGPASPTTIMITVHSHEQFSAKKPETPMKTQAVAPEAVGRMEIFTLLQEVWDITWHRETCSASCLKHAQVMSSVLRPWVRASNDLFTFGIVSSWHSHICVQGWSSPVRGGKAQLNH